MKQETLFLAAYDIRNPARLRRGLQILRDYALGHQKSVFECPLRAGEAEEMLAKISAVIDPQEDRFALVRLDSRCASHALGRGVAARADDIFYVG
ncbi:MAG: CRISPR-associated endonuclease Cas2 [Parahaliea sp.]